MKTKLKRQSNDPVISPAESTKLRELYRACWTNAQQLFHEGKLLAEHGHFARATFLAITAHEEAGKAQLVSDYAQGCASQKEFEDSFRRHEIKHAYMMRQASIVGLDTTLVYDTRQTTYQIRLREKALYVEYRKGTIAIPSEISKDECDYVFERVFEALAEIEDAERLNGRIGSKSLFK